MLAHMTLQASLAFSREVALCATEYGLLDRLSSYHRCGAGSVHLDKGIKVTSCIHRAFTQVDVDRVLVSHVFQPGNLLPAVGARQCSTSVLSFTHVVGLLSPVMSVSVHGIPAHTPGARRPPPHFSGPGRLPPNFPCSSHCFRRHPGKVGRKPHIQPEHHVVSLDTRVF